MKITRVLKQIVETRFPTWNLEIFAFFLIYSIAFVLLVRQRKLSKKQKIAALLLFFYCYNVLVITLLMRNEYMPSYSCDLRPFKFVYLLFNDFYRGGLWEVPFNILLFVPIGFVLPYLIKNKKKYAITVFIGFCATLTIELLQLFTMLGSLETDDILANTFGTWLGVVIYKKALKHHRKSPCRKARTQPVKKSF